MNATISNGTRYWRHLYDETLIFIFDRVSWFCCWWLPQLLLWLVICCLVDVSMSFALNLQRNCGTDFSIISLMMLWFAYIFHRYIYAQFFFYTLLFSFTEHHFQFSMHIFPFNISQKFMNMIIIDFFYLPLIQISTVLWARKNERWNTIQFN